MNSATTPRCIRNLARAARDLPAVRCEDCSGLGVCPGVIIGGGFAGQRKKYDRRNHLYTRSESNGDR